MPEKARQLPANRRDKLLRSNPEKIPAALCGGAEGSYLQTGSQRLQQQLQLVQPSLLTLLMQPGLEGNGLRQESGPLSDCL